MRERAAWHGPLVAARIARSMVVYARCNGDEQQTSALLRHRSHLSDVVHQVQDVIDDRFSERLPLASLAAGAGCERVAVWPVLSVVVDSVSYMSSVEVGGLVAAARAVAAGPVADLPDSQVADELLALRALADAAEAAFLSRLAAFDARGVAQGEGLSTRAWLRHRARIAPGESGRWLRIARGLQQFPVVAGALAVGQIRVPHAAAIVDGAALLGTDVVAGCQDVLVEAARVDEPSRLRAGLRGMGAAVDNPRAVREAERRDEGRWLDVTTTFDGAVHLAGVLGAEDGAVVKAAIDALAAPGGLSTSTTGDPRVATGGAGASARAGGSAQAGSAGRGGDSRTAGQRRADALVELCRRHLDSGGLPTTGGQAPHVVVVTDLATLEARAGGFGELPDGNVLTGEAVRRLACEAGVTRVITGPGSQPLDVGRAQRTATAAQRRALRIRDGDQCLFPGCDRPGAWAQAHHVNWWSRGGRTDIDEMVLLCKRHHTSVHEGGWQIKVVAPGRFVFTNPAGHDIPARPASTTRELITRLTNASTPTRAGPAHDTPRKSDQDDHDGPGPHEHDRLGRDDHGEPDPSEPPREQDHRDAA